MCIIVNVEYATPLTEHIGKSFRHHRGNNFARERGKYACLNAAAESVRKDDDGGIVVALHNVDMVAAELLSEMVYAFVTYIGAKIIHRKCSPSVW